MKFKKIASLIMVFMLCILFTGCGNAEGKYGRFEDFNESTIGVRRGKAHDEYVHSRLEDSNVIYYTSNDEMLNDLEKGKIDACVLDSKIAEYVDSVNKKITMFPSTIEDVNYSLCLSDSFDFYDECYDVLNSLQESGELDKLKDKWFSKNETIMRLEIEEYSNYPIYNGIIRVVADSDAAPVSYVDANGTAQGYEIELIHKIAKELNMQVQVDLTNDFELLLDSIGSDKYNMAAGFIISDDKNATNVVRLQDTVHGGTYLMIKESDLKTVSNKKAEPINNLSDLSGRKVGLLAGSMFESFLVNNEVSTINKFYKSNEEALEAVLRGEVAGTIIDKGIAKAYCERNDKLTYFNIDKIEYGVLFNKHSIELMEEFNSFLQKITMNGTLKRMNNTWLNGTEKDKILPEYKTLPATNGTLRLATSTSLEPYSYIKPNGELAGFDLELVILFCEEKGFGLEIIDGTFDSVLNNISNGTCDLGAAAIIKTSEREAKYRFSETTSTGGISLVVLAENTAIANNGKINLSIDEQFYNSFIANDNWLILLKGMGITFVVGIVSIVLGTLLGFILSSEYVGGSEKTFKIIYLCSNVFKRTPLIVWLSIFAYLVFGGHLDTGIIVGVITFSIFFGFETLESYRKIHRKFTDEQKACGYNLHLNKTVSFFYICHAIYTDDAFDDLKSNAIRTFKNTTLLGLVYAFDFAYACNYARMNSFVNWIPILLMFVFYFIVDSIIDQLVDRIKAYYIKEKRSTNDFNFESVTKFSLEEDDENLFKLNIKEGTGNLTRGMQGPIIHFKDATVKYENAIGLDDVNVDINKGECVAIAGTAKSGITTFFQVINGYTNLTSGRVTTFGKDVSIYDNKSQILNGISIILRNDQMFPYKNVIENVMYLLTNSENISKRNAYVKAYRMLYKLGLADKAFLYENELSISEKKRVLMARALIFFPDILILDHIEDGLTQNELVGLTLILKQVAESGTTLLIASDDLNWLKQLTKRMLIFDEGKIIDDGPTEELINRPSKAKTMEFVQKSTVFSAVIKSKLFDHVEIAGKIWTFANNNELGEEFSQRLEDIVGIIEKEIIVKVMPSTFNMKMKMNYTKALNSVRFVIEYDGNDFDYINSMSVDKYDIFARLIESIHYSYDGINKYEIIIPATKRY